MWGKLIYTIFYGIPGIKNAAAAVCCLLLITACADPYSIGEHRKYGVFTPRPLFMENIPDGDDPYSQGFRDGCNQAVGVIGSGMLRNWGFSYDINRGIEDKEYYNGYRIGSTYCTHYLDPLFL